MPLLDKSVTLIAELGVSILSHSMTQWKLPGTRQTRQQTRKLAAKRVEERGDSLIFMPGKMMSFLVPSRLRPML